MHHKTSGAVLLDADVRSGLKPNNILTHRFLKCGTCVGRINARNFYEKNKIKKTQNDTCVCAIQWQGGKCSVQSADATNEVS